MNADREGIKEEEEAMRSPHKNTDSFTLSLRSDLFQGKSENNGIKLLIVHFKKVT
jgi:hypothetical protein